MKTNKFQIVLKSHLITNKIKIEIKGERSVLIRNEENEIEFEAHDWRSRAVVVRDLVEGLRTDGIDVEVI